MRCLRLAIALAITLPACSGPAKAPHAVADPGDDDDAKGPFIDSKTFKPKSFSAHVTGEGRAVIFIPGLGCPGEMWDDTVAHWDGKIQAHVLTLSGFAGRKPVKPPLAAAVRKELVRYIKANRLDHPIVVGHSMGGFIAYWLAASAPNLLGGVVVVDAGPALGDNDVETARTLRNMWAQAGDDELPEQVKTAYTSMVADPKHIAPYLDAIAQSDRHAIGDAIYELVTTDVRDKLDRIKAPLLLVLADGGMQSTYKAMAAGVKDKQIVVVPKAKHFVFLDDPDAFYAAVSKFIARQDRGDDTGE